MLLIILILSLLLMTTCNESNKPDDIAVEILEKLVLESQQRWLNPNNKYRDYKRLEIDKKGSFGERFFVLTLTKIYYRRLNVEYQDGDQGDWDLKFNGYKFEIKTASLDVNDKFQNEGFKDNGDYDGIMFLGVAPNQLYIKFVAKENIPFDKLHNRGKRGTGKGYKWDFKIKDMIKIDSLQDIKDEFETQFPFVLKKKKHK